MESPGSWLLAILREHIMRMETIRKFGAATKTARDYADEVLAGKHLEAVHEILVLGKGMRRDALIRHVRNHLIPHPEKKKLFEQLIGNAFDVGAK